MIGNLDRYELAVLALVKGSCGSRGMPSILDRVMKLAFLALNTRGDELDFKYFDDVPFVVCDHGVFSEKICKILDRLHLLGLVRRVERIHTEHTGIRLRILLECTNRTPSLGEILEELRKRDPELAGRLLQTLHRYGCLNEEELEKLVNRVAQIDEVVKAVFHGVPVKKVMEIRHRARELVEQGEATIEIEI